MAQLATLRKIQQTINRTEFALIGSVITRWGFQYRMLSSVLRSQYADEVPGLKIELRETLRSSDFWNHLKKLIAILKPIDDAISMLEDVKSNIGNVINRWRLIETHLQSHIYSEFGVEIRTLLTSAFPNRINRQFEDVHWMAFCLDPNNASATLEGRSQERVHEAIRRYCMLLEVAMAFFMKPVAGNIEKNQKPFWQVQIDI
jgi:hypothetical protein